jgi:hypothetical protein
MTTDRPAASTPAHPRTAGTGSPPASATSPDNPGTPGHPGTSSACQRRSRGSQPLPWAPLAILTQATALRWRTHSCNTKRGGAKAIVSNPRPDKCAIGRFLCSAQRRTRRSLHTLAGSIKKDGRVVGPSTRGAGAPSSGPASGERARAAAEMAATRSVMRALDPENLVNLGEVLASCARCWRLRPTARAAVDATRRSRSGGARGACARR